MRLRDALGDDSQLVVHTLRHLWKKFFGEKREYQFKTKFEENKTGVDLLQELNMGAIIEWIISWRWGLSTAGVLLFENAYKLNL